MLRAIPVLISLLTLALAACGGSESGAVTPSPGVLADGSQGPAQSRTASPTEAATPTPTPEPRLISLDWLAGDVAVPGLGGPPAAPAPDAGLQETVAQALAGFGGQASVVVHSLSDGRYAEINGAQVWYAASTFKAAVLLTAYQQRDAGELNFDELVTLEEKYAEYDLGTLEYLDLKVGDQLSIRDAVKGMIVVSDTSLATLVTEKVTGNDVDATLRQIGATTMTVNDRELPTTALDLTQLMIAIAAGQDVTSESRNEMISLLAQEWFTQGILAGLPAGVEYAHKSGRLGDATHDTAVVWGPAGPYVITVMTDGSGGWTPIADVSAAVYAYFAANP